MKRHNERLSVTKRELPPNAIYESYRPLFDSIFVKEYIQDHEYDHLYIYERFEYSKGSFLSHPWMPVKVVSDPLMDKNFTWQSCFGPQERELLSFLLVDVPGSGKMLHIVGDMGTGKSTFVRFMFQQYLPKQRFFEKGKIWYIDLLKVIRKEDEYSWDSTVRVVFRALRECFVETEPEGNECRRWDDEAVMTFISNQVKNVGKNQVVVVIDNIDQFPLSFQVNLAKFCQSLANTTTCTIVLALRDFNLHHFTPSANSLVGIRYVLRQRAPILSMVVAHRLKYYLKTNPDFKRERRFSIDVHEFAITFSDVTEFIEKFINLLLRPHIKDALDHLSNHNIRLGLLWALDFLASWNINLPQIAEQALTAIASRHEPIRSIDDFDTFILALGYCNHDVYFPSISRLENIFSAFLSNPTHDLFIKYRILKFCHGQHHEVGQEILLNHLRRFGYADDEINTAANYLLAVPHRLMRSQDGDQFEKSHLVEMLPAGYYYIENIITRIYYLQIVSDDMFLPDDIRPVRGSKLKRFRNLIRMIEYMGNYELEDTHQFLKSFDNYDAGVREFIKIYGNLPLCEEILKSLERLMSGKLPSEESKAGIVDVSPLIDKVRELSSAFVKAYKGILKT